MPKNKTFFTCSVCGQKESQWQGRCRSCGTWNSFHEQANPISGISGVSAPTSGRAATGIKGDEQGHTKAIRISEISLPKIERISSTFIELDRVLGGGLVPGSVIMLGGEPGIGKSTLLLQIAARLEQHRTHVLYVSAEESALQLKIRAKRLGCGESSFSLLCSNHLGNIVADIQHRASAIETNNKLPLLLIIDSLQTILEPSLGSVPGTPSQLRHITQVLQDCCREYQLTMLLVAHLTKDGVIAGPRTVEHMVDCVIYFEHGEHDLRILQTNKNRFGSTSEMGILKMSDTGLIEIECPQQYFLSQRENNIPAGIAIAPVHEGSRSLLVEVQALTVPAKSSVSRIFADRLDNARVSRIAAVLERHTGILFSNQDIYINVAGGLRLQDIALDLPLALTLLSARLNQALPLSITSAAELSLAGELRPIKHEELRLRSATEFNMKQLILPKAPKAQKTQSPKTNTETKTKAEIKVFRFNQIKEIYQMLFAHSANNLAANHIDKND